ncbi:MAG: hypothetical protein F4123_01105 [Gemmatimonadetes bacterium]|nr:hypothetical protein [Gemmatimonadota bacterium]MYB98191.1 hypothetical protein [Gemmatimonadota bacterium]MYI44988.1 hypothetical protein [Gemmatimonadota bacterium]
MKKISPVAINALKDALTLVYWFKKELRTFLTSCLTDSSILSRLNWDAYKREIVGSLVDHMTRHENEYQADLLRLMAEVARMSDFSHLLRLEDGKKKAAAAQAAVQALRRQMKDHLELVEEQQAIGQRREQARLERLASAAIKTRLSELHEEYCGMLSLSAQKRGFALERLMYDLFEVFDLDPKASFKVLGEQIDGSFSFETTDFLFEARWESPPTSRSDLDAFDGKISRKPDNTLGLFLSINGFSEDGVKAYSAGRSLMILMDGAHLAAVLEGRLDLVSLLLRMRRHAAQTGCIYLPIQQLLH